MPDFSFKEIDQEGLETLDVIAGADKFNRWMYDTISPFCSGRILEIGSGIGNISQFFATEQRDIVLSDIRDNYCAALAQKFGAQGIAVHNIDLVAADFDQRYAALLGTFDTVFALNVVEHIEDDVLAVANCAKFLKKGGTLLILVPAYQALYNHFDKELYHYRRYNKKMLGTLFQKNQLAIRRQWYFNLIGILGWFVSGKLQKNKTIPKGQMGLYNKLVPVFKLADALTFKKAGLSVITAGTKN
jgi:2-polyprenyl-3-methyl-5-hydroxy-6-metoxy-1,4-benzoquinol methylase